MKPAESDIVLALTIMKKHAVQGKGILNLIKDYEFDDISENIKIVLPDWINEIAAEFDKLYGPRYVDPLCETIFHILETYFKQKWPEEQRDLMRAVLTLCYEKPGSWSVH